MEIVINGQSFETTEKALLAQILTEYGAKAPFAVAINGDFVTREKYNSIVMVQGDCVELLSPIQGG